MSDLEQILFRLKINPEQRDAAFQQLAAKNVYSNDNAGRAKFITELMASPPADAKYTPEQLVIADNFQAQSNYRTNQTQGFKGLVLAGILAAAAYVGSAIMPEIKGNESHVEQRVSEYERANERHRFFHGGRDAPWYKEREAVVEESSETRETARDVGYGLGGLLGLSGLGLLAWALYNRKKIK